MQAFLEGLLFGLGMIAFIGPVFFYLLQTTLQAGFWAGATVALSIVLGDLLCIVLCSFGAIPFFENPDNKFWLGIAGGLILLGMGLKYMFKPKIHANECVVDKTISKSAYLNYFLNGFLINFVNPFVFAVWIGVIGYSQTKFGTGWPLILFLAASLLGIFITDMSKVFFAQKIKQLIKETFLLKLYRIIGILLTIFGLRLLFISF